MAEPDQSQQPDTGTAGITTPEAAPTLDAILETPASGCTRGREQEGEATLARIATATPAWTPRSGCR